MRLHVIIASIMASLPGFGATARAAGLEECGGFLGSPDMSCQGEVGDGCTPRCNEISCLQACASKAYPGCREQCNSLAPAGCGGACEEGCVQNCDGYASECERWCVDDCGAACDERCAVPTFDLECHVACSTTCFGVCDDACSAVSPETGCEERCAMGCSGACRARAMADCQIACQTPTFPDCLGGMIDRCQSACESEDGAMFCDGAFVDAPDLRACAEAIMPPWDETTVVDTPPPSTQDGGCAISAVRNANWSCVLLVALGLGLRRRSAHGSRWRA